jgi:choline dehydrogenase-like flavoprotein
MESILATAWDEGLTVPYDVIVVGSGYGGAITAARLANAPIDPKLKVCLSAGRNGRSAVSLTRSNT